MRWEDIDDNWFWKPQHSPHRNKRLHAIPLSSLTQRVLGQRQARGYVFAGPIEGTHVSDEGTLARKVRRHSDISDFFLHALRHTAETRMAEAKLLQPDDTVRVLR
jgi:integrase